MGHGNSCYGWGMLLAGIMLLNSCSAAGGEMTTQILQTPSPNESPVSTLEAPTATASFLLSCDMVTVSNPAATYCVMLGYQNGIQEMAGEQVSTCTMPDGTLCDAWQFFRGTCGQEFSWCAQNGYQIQNVIENNGSSTQEYAICVDADGNTIGTVAELSGLQSLLENCLPR